MFTLGEKEKELEREQRERNCHLLAKIYDALTDITYRTPWSKVCQLHLSCFK